MAIAEIENRQEVRELKTNAEKALAFAQQLKVTDEAGFKTATNSLIEIKEATKRAEAVRRFFVDPLNEHVKRINALFKPKVDMLLEAERLIKTEQLVYHTEQERKAEEAKKRELKKVAAGKTTIEKAAEKVAAIEQPETTVKADTGAVTFRTIRKAVITDIDKLPRHYLVPDMQRINRDALAGVPIPGVKVVEEKQVSAKKHV